MTATPWGKFFWADWLADPGLRACTASARGLWMDLLCVAALHDPPGYVAIAGRAMSNAEIARLSGIDVAVAEQLVTELKTRNVCSQTSDGTLYSRRIIRDAKKLAKLAKRVGVGKGGNPTIRRGSVPKSERFRPYRRSDSPQKTLRIFQRSDSKCHWCGVGLVWEPTGPDIPPNLFHVDHVLAICDGGDNSENNLVAACAKCNHERARLPKYQSDPNLFKTDNNDGKSPTPTPMARARPRSRSQNLESFLSLGGECESDPPSKINGHDASTSGPATALPDGRAGPPSFDSEASKASKRPHELTKAEFEQQIAKRKIGGP